MTRIIPSLVLYVLLAALVAFQSRAIPLPESNLQVRDDSSLGNGTSQADFQKRAIARPKLRIDTGNTKPRLTAIKKPTGPRPKGGKTAQQGASKSSLSLPSASSPPTKAAQQAAGSSPLPLDLGALRKRTPAGKRRLNIVTNPDLPLPGKRDSVSGSDTPDAPNSASTSGKRNTREHTSADKQAKPSNAPRSLSATPQSDSSLGSSSA